MPLWRSERKTLPLFFSHLTARAQKRLGGIESVWLQHTVRIVVGALGDRQLLGKTSLGKLVGASISQNHIADVDVQGAVPTRIVGNSELSDETEDGRRSAPLSISAEQ